MAKSRLDKVRLTESQYVYDTVVYAASCDPFELTTRGFVHAVSKQVGTKVRRWCWLKTLHTWVVRPQGMEIFEMSCCVALLSLLEP